MLSNVRFVIWGLLIIYQYAAEGCNYGKLDIEGNQVILSSVVSNRRIFDFKLDTVALCVVPANNRDDVEVQFLESEKTDKHTHEDSLVQMTFHFPTVQEEDDEEEGSSAAEVFQRSVMDTGIIRSITGDIIAEFSKEQGNFVTPRGKYAIQVTEIVDVRISILFLITYWLHCL